MGTGTQYKEEVVARAETLLESGDPHNEERGAELAALIETPEEHETPQTVRGERSVGVLASEVEELPLEWVWRNWIPRQFVGIFVGDSGIGKSSLVRDLIRRITRGEPMPDGQPCDQCGVVIISYEEPTETVLKPRLREAGADLSKIKILSTVELQGQIGQPAKRAFRVPEDLGILREAIYEADAGVVFIDPLMSMTDKAISRNQTARPILDAMQQLAQDTACAIVVVAHINKGRSTEIRNRMNASKAFYDMPRFILAAAADVSNPKRATLWMEKHSLSPAVPTLTYELEDGHVRFISGHIEEARADFEKQEADRTDNAIITHMKQHPEAEYQGASISRSIRMNHDAVRKQLERLKKRGLVEQTRYGWYRLPQNAEEKNEDVTVSQSQLEVLTPSGTQIAPTEPKLSPEEYIAAVNAQTVPLDVTTLPEDRQAVVAQVTNGKGTEK